MRMRMGTLKATSQTRIMPDKFGGFKEPVAILFSGEVRVVQGLSWIVHMECDTSNIETVLEYSIRIRYLLVTEHFRAIPHISIETFEEGQNPL